MGKIGLLAGDGSLPVEFVRSAKKRDDTAVVFAVRGMASPVLDEEADKVYWLNIGQLARFLFLLKKERIDRIAFLGKIRKEVIYGGETPDTEMRDFVARVKDKQDYSILRKITDRLAKIGVTVIDTTAYLSALLPEKGVLGRVPPDARLKGDMEFGFDTAKKLAGMDIGQTVIVKDRTIVAVEAMEGTDAAIDRGKSIAGAGCVMVKVSRPDQDMRWDIPTVGRETMAKLIECKFSALAVENGRLYLLHKQELLEMADSKGIAVVAL
ncbi:MAG: UDP-2,3-diacylglucosamine diphosphatase LpxI [Candidatus Omnitrophica bacterium]|nr:UDP-2,3-diacylglucosamine diphosphatase LpxI [Candidatus Omnitrophota bacterium]